MANRGQHGSVSIKGVRVKQWVGRYRTYFLDPTTGEETHIHKRVVLGKKSGMTKFTAEERLRLVIERETSERKNIPLDPNVTFGWYTRNRYLVNHRSSWRPATLHSTTKHLELYVLPTLGGRPLGEIERHECSLLLERLAAKYSKSVVAYCKVRMKSILEEAVDDSHISQNPMHKVKMPLTRQSKKPILAKEDAQRLFAAIKEDKHRALLAIGSFCAMRTSEVFGLTWGAYFGDTLLVKSTAWEGQFFEDRTKTDSSRALVTVPASVRPWIEIWRRQCRVTSADALMFPAIRRNKDKRQVPMRPRNFLQDTMKPLAVKLGIDPRLITFQVLRRTFGTTMQKHGTMKDVQAHLRHASITTTADIYVQQIPESVRAAVNATTWEILGVSGQEHTPEVATQLCPTVPQLPDLSDAKLLKRLVDAGGIEPPTCRLRVECSAS